MMLQAMAGFQPQTYDFFPPGFKRPSSRDDTVGLFIFVFRFLMIYQVVVSNIFYFHPYLGEDSHFD